MHSIKTKMFFSTLGGNQEIFALQFLLVNLKTLTRNENRKQEFGEEFSWFSTDMHFLCFKRKKNENNFMSANRKQFSVAYDSFSCWRKLLFGNHSQCESQLPLSGPGFLCHLRNNHEFPFTFRYVAEKYYKTLLCRRMFMEFFMQRERRWGGRRRNMEIVTISYKQAKQIFHVHCKCNEKKASSRLFTIFLFLKPTVDGMSLQTFHGCWDGEAPCR